MEQFLVEQVLGKDLKVGDDTVELGIIKIASQPNEIATSKYGLAIFHVKLPSPDILIPSEEEIENSFPHNDILQHVQLANYHSRYGANWAISQLKELNPNVNFKTK